MATRLARGSESPGHPRGTGAQSVAARRKDPRRSRALLLGLLALANQLTHALPALLA